MGWFKRRNGDFINDKVHFLGTRIDPRWIPPSASILNPTGAAMIPPPRPWDAIEVTCSCGSVSYHPQSCTAVRLGIGESFSRSMETFGVELLADVADAIDERLSQIDREAAWERAIERDPTMAVAALLALFRKAAPVLGDALCDRVRVEVGQRRDTTQRLDDCGVCDLAPTVSGYVRGVQVSCPVHGTTPEPHHYVSTACLHGEHGYCASTVKADGTPKDNGPARCKWCSAPCRCTRCDHTSEDS